ncbi:MAG: (E)-4-hydroxy-3-methylbut-2-enyl-diphosphate synthase, partial [Verrucomicrobiota bacterium]
MHLDTTELSYCDDLFAYHKRETREVLVGQIGIGGKNPIRVQSMLTSDTRDTEACIEEALGLVNAGCEIVRVTAQTRKYAANLENIKAGLLAEGCDTPLVADIHFKPDAALEAAKWVEKVRVNPGNCADKKKFEIREYDDEQYAEELDRIREKFEPLVHLCKERSVAMRIGTNHGSLSDRIMNRYGDTPLGMVESALEFARIARDLEFHSFVFSMKASNPKVMIEAYRLLIARLRQLGSDWNYPLHLGVTEAGDGEDGRIKSAIGIGSLLKDGIGDTIRVSLTEDAIHEVPVARAIVKMIGEEANRPSPPNSSTQAPCYDPFSYVRRASDPIEVQGIPLGGNETIRVSVTQEHWNQVATKIQQLGDFQPEFIYETSGVVEVDPRDDAALKALANAPAAKL